eukprot:TRINITY_DN7754_c0_g1_i1.p1 TRINITY_DN7754_c0_g1~~TRINITY_DN7754_c0_g1_i1.p1  ORF type:complete len:412 (+),score=161.23 TRINITY_DN7754_c0_g1_i1:614-1849(+)
MTEEEQVFQPLLDKYFDEKELETLLSTVLEQHRLWKEKVSAEKSLKLVKRKREHTDDEDDYIAEIAASKLDTLRFRRSYCEEVNDFFGRSFTSSVNDCVLENLPNEILLRVFGYLSPRDLLLVCSRVSRRWNRLYTSPALWANVFPVMWSRGHWSFTYDETFMAIKDEDREFTAPELLIYHQEDTFDEDDDNNNAPLIIKSESSKKDDGEALFLRRMSIHFLPKIGSGVKRLILSGSRSLSSFTARSFLMKTPNVIHLDMSYSSQIDDDVFKGLRRYAALRKLRSMDLSGCKQLTDNAFERISSCYFPLRRAPRMSQLSRIALSGVYKISNDGLDQLSVHAQTLEFIDLSGCFRLSGAHLNAFISQCSRLKPENLYYCNMISDGPYPNSANGCQNLDCPLRNCCQLAEVRY